MSETQKPEPVSYASSQGLTAAELGELVKEEFSRPPTYSEDDAYDFFAVEPEASPKPASDLIGKMLVAMFVIATLGFLASVGLIFAAANTVALIVSMTSLTLSISTVVISVIATPR